VPIYWVDTVVDCAFTGGFSPVEHITEVAVSIATNRTLWNERRFLITTLRLTEVYILDIDYFERLQKRSIDISEDMNYQLQLTLLKLWSSHPGRSIEFERERICLPRGNLLKRQLRSLKLFGS
jgi:hypothetical protein